MVSRVGFAPGNGNRLYDEPQRFNRVVLDFLTQVTQSFQLIPRQPWTRPLLWGISLLFRRVIERHLRAMALQPA